MQSISGLLLTQQKVILYTGANGPLYGFSLFLPSIINQLGKLVGASVCWTPYSFLRHLQALTLLQPTY